jgi:hypothetical protein
MTAASWSTATRDYDGYSLERFEFHNGVDSVVPGILLIPKERKGPCPTTRKAAESAAGLPIT